ncbi:hypothetical protein [Cupriavidus pauculus]|uniref:hypothetical protein n=1 Tax=Cupriavidus pauculus TaxID=82633 RepID=UPI001D0C6754|nr:hypothetical protein [Cupriavidus pauculus]
MHAVQSFTLSQVREALFRASIYAGSEDWRIRMRSALAAPLVDGVRVVRAPLNGADLYDWTQTESALRDGDVFLSKDGKAAGVLMEAWPVLVAGDCEALHTLAETTTWETVDGGKYAAAAAVARKLVA